MKQRSKGTRSVPLDAPYFKERFPEPAEVESWPGLWQRNRDGKLSLWKPGESSIVLPGDRWRPVLKLKHSRKAVPYPWPEINPS